MKQCKVTGAIHKNEPDEPLTGEQAASFVEKFFGECPSITELEGLPTEGNLSGTVQNQLRAKLGSVNHGLFAPTMGTVMQLSSGKWFDWWKNEGETITIKESE